MGLMFFLVCITNSSAQNVGIGTNTPQAKLHIQNGISGFPYNNGNLVLETNSNGPRYLDLITPSTNESGVLFGNNTNAAVSVHWNGHLEQ
jgi:hypothetical protein